MSAAAAQTLSRAHLKKLLASIGTVVSDLPVPAYTEHDWRASRYFDRGQLAVLQSKAMRLGHIYGHIFAQACQCDFTVTVMDVIQIPAQGVMEGMLQDDGQTRFLALGMEPDAACGVLVLPPRTVQLWAKMVLGESDADLTEEAALSALELSLLYDLCKALAEATRLMDPSLALQCDRTLSTTCSVSWPPTDSLLRITLSVQPNAQEATECMLVLPCACYAPMVGKVGEQPQTERPDRDYTGALKQAIQRLRVPITARLGTLSLTFQDLVSLTSNDILVLDKSVYQPLDVALSDKSVFQGIPGQHRGQLAVLITETRTRKC